MIFFLFTTFILGAQVYACPPSETISPLCHCNEHVETPVMVCDGVLCPEDLIAPVRAVAVSRSHIETLNIQNSSLQYIPGSIFKGTGIQKVYFLSTEILSLSDEDDAFQGLENTLTEILATDAHYVAQWEWQQLRNLKKLQVIDVNWISMGSVSEEFPELPNLKYLGIIKGEISFIVDYAFKNLPKLQILNLKGNDIEELKRNMLPEPADELSILDFSDNDLSTLPEDFFTSMPSLLTVKLDTNKFVTLSENVFSGVLPSLQDLTMSENDFRCDCRLRWITEVTTPLTFVAKCVFPDALHGTSLKNLHINDLYC